MTLNDFVINSATQQAYQGKTYTGDGIIDPKNIYVELDKTTGIKKEYDNTKDADPDNVKYYDKNGTLLGTGNNTSSIIATRDQGQVALSVKSALFNDENSTIERKDSTSLDKLNITYTVDLDDATGKGNYVLNAGPIPVTGHTQTATSSNKTSKSVTDPTTGGVSASYAMLGDINITEPKALIGFAGRRVIENTIHQKLPDDFQTAEYLEKHGFIDKVVERAQLKPFIAKMLGYFGV